MKRLIQAGLVSVYVLVPGLVITQDLEKAYSAYKDAIEELERRQGPGSKQQVDWVALEKAMRAALVTDSVDSGNSVARNRFTRIGGKEYFPNFYLGLALSYLERCTESLDRLDQSDRHQAIAKKTLLYRILNERRNYCQGQGFMLYQERDAAYSDGQALRRQIDEAANSLRNYAAQNQSRWIETFRNKEGELLNRRDAAQKAFDSSLPTRRAKEVKDALVELRSVARETNSLLAEFKQHLATAPQPAIEPAPPDPAPKSPATNPSAELAELGTKEFREAFSRASALRKRLTERSATSSASQAARSQLEAAEESLRGASARFEEARKRSDDGAMKKAREELASIGAELKAVAALLPRVPADSVPATLQKGADLLFTGNYQEALDALTDEVADETGQNVKPHFHVLRAAAYLALFDSSGRKNDELKRQAADEVRKCLALKSDFEPNGAAFSPRFVAFFKNPEGVQ